MQVLIWFGYPSDFVDASEILVMVDDVVMPSNLLVAPVEQEKFKEMLFDVNVSQRPHEEKLSRRVVRTWVDHSTWDHRLSPNPHALTIYLEFVHARGVAPKRFEECQCEDDDVRLHYRTSVLDDGHYHWLWCLINPLSMEHRAEYLACTIHCILIFLQLWYIPLSRLLSCNSPEATQVKMLIFKFDFDSIEESDRSGN